MSKKNHQKRVSSLDVARIAGVSQSTVSRTYTPGASISADKKKRVLDAAQKLGYQPNIIARSLSQQSTKIIGIVMTRFNNPFYAMVLGEFTRRLQEKGYIAMLLNVDGDEEVEQALPSALQYQVDGIIITSATLSSKMVDSCLATQTPVVLFNRYSEHGNINAVFCDSVAGGRAVARALIADGHKRLAYIAGEEGSSTSRDRILGFTDLLQEVGIAVHSRGSGDYSYDSGYQSASVLLDQKDLPDAIFCVNDLMAMGALDLTRKRKMRVPQDLAIVGFDDIPLARTPGYELTTIRQPVGHLVNATIERLMRAMDAPVIETVIKKMQGQLVRRATTRNLGS